MILVHTWSVAILLMRSPAARPRWRHATPCHACALACCCCFRSAKQQQRSTNTRLNTTNKHDDIAQLSFSRYFWQVM